MSRKSIGSVSRAILTAGIILVGLAGSSLGFAQEITAASGKVKIEWLGHEFYRLTSPKGVVILTSPWLANPDGPVALSDLARTDFVLVPNAHTDDMGNPIEIASLRLMTANNPKLRTVIPSHARPGAPILTEGKRELDRLRIGGLMFVPELRKVYEY
jgi:hypothetical protein